MQENKFDSKFKPIRIGQISSKLFQHVLATIMLIFKGLTDMTNSLFKKAVSTLAFLLSNNAGHLASTINDACCKGWDRALIEYITTLLTDSAAETQPPGQKGSIRLLVQVGWTISDQRKLALMCFGNPSLGTHRSCIDQIISIPYRLLEATFGITHAKNGGG